MTKSDFIKKYGDALVVFTSYYKYTFSFEGVLEDGSKIEVGVGGDSESIYRFEVAPGVAEKVSTLSPYVGKVTKDGTTVAEFYDF